MSPRPTSSGRVARSLSVVRRLRETNNAKGADDGRDDALTVAARPDLSDIRTLDTVTLNRFRDRATSAFAIVEGSN
jgi:hypothetical protein